MEKEKELEFKCVNDKCEKEAIYGNAGTIKPKHGPLYCEAHNLDEDAEKKIVEADDGINN